MANDFWTRLKGMTREDLEAEIEREEVEQAHHLTGDELADNSWGDLYSSAVLEDPTYNFRYWHDGCPEWDNSFSRDERNGFGEDEDGNTLTFRTVYLYTGGYQSVLLESLWEPGESGLPEDAVLWTKVRSYFGDAEVECPGGYEEDEEKERRLRRALSCSQDALDALIVRYSKHDVEGLVLRGHARRNKRIRTLWRQNNQHIPQQERKYPSRCDLCDEAVGDEHGYIYIGAGEQAIYQNVSPSEDE